MAFVQAVSVSTGAPVNSLTTAAITTSNASSLVLGMSMNHNNTPNTPTDSKTNTWNAHPNSPNNGSGAGSMAAGYLAANITGGASHTFTATQSATDLWSMSVGEYSGRAVSPIDVTGHGSDATTHTTGHSCGSITTTVAGDDVVAVIADDKSTSGAFTQVSPWTIATGSVSQDGSTYWAGFQQYNAGVAVGTYTANYTSNSSSKGDALLWALQPLSGAALASAAADSSSATAALSTGITPAAAAADTSSATGNIVAGASLAAGATDTTSATAGLTTAIKPAASAADSSSAAGALTNFANVTLTGTLYTGVGGILDPNFWVSTVPGVGTTVFYDPAHITVAPNGEISADTNNCQAVVQFFDGSQWQIGLVVIVPTMVGYLVTASAATGVLTTSIQAIAAATDLASATGALTAHITPAAAAADVTSATAALTAAIQFATGATDTATAQATLAGTQNAMASAATDVSSAGASLTTAIQVAATLVDVITAAGALSTAIRLAAAGQTSSSATAQLQGSGPIALGAAASNAATAGASLLTQIKMGVAAADLVSIADDLSTRIQMLSAAASASGSTAALTALAGIGATASSLSSATGQLTTLVRLTADALAQTLAAGNLSTSIQMAAAAASLSSAGAALNTLPFVSPPNSLADVRTVRALPSTAQDYGQVEDLPYGEFYQAPGEKLWYAIDWTGWLANLWQQDRDVLVGQSIRPSVPNGYQNTCSRAGRTGAREPSWIQYPGANVQDGSAMWQTAAIDDTSLGSTLVDSAWTAPGPIVLATGGVVDEVAFVLIDTTGCTVGVDYDVYGMATMSDGERNLGKIRIKVR